MTEPTPPSSADVARALLRLGAVSLRPEDPFTWASGLRSPIYCDNRLLISSPPDRRMVRDGFRALLDGLEAPPEVIAGTATAGIPHAAWLAEALDAPMVYVRGSAKAHGRRNQIEGALERGARVVLVEDLVSTGGSSLDAVEALREAGAHVVAVLAIFSYGFASAEARFAEAGCPLLTLADLPALLAAARADGALSADALASIQAWRADPQAWSEERGEDGR